MMDYDPAHVELYPERASAKDRYVDMTLSMLVKAVGQEKEFSDAEFRIRIFFEHYLTSLSRFNYFLTSGAIEPQERKNCARILRTRSS
jgi:hypothetical protein